MAEWTVIASVSTTGEASRRSSRTPTNTQTVEANTLITVTTHNSTAFDSDLPGVLASWLVGVTDVGMSMQSSERVAISR